jgi:PAS domain S-box-containing protein
VPAHDDKLLYSVAKDITEKKELEELIDEMSRLARIGAWEVDLVKNELYWSDMTRKIHEVEPDFVPDLDTSINFYVEEDRPIVNEAVKRAIKHNIPFDFELRILTAKGNERWVRSIGRSEFEDGVCIKLLGSFQDIHSKKLVELALERSNKSLTDYKLALDEASNVVITDSEGVILYVNESTCELSGYSREELIGQHTRINKSGYHPAVFFDEMWKTISAGNTWRGELKNKAKDGSLYWVDTTIIPFTDKQGKPFQYLAIRFDITAKKNAETAVIKALEEKNTILESIGDCFFALDKDWTVTYWNRAAEEVLQMKKEQIVGKNLWEVYDDAIPTAFYENYRKAMEKNVAVHFQEYYEALAIWFEVSAYPSANGLSVYFKDVTHRKEAEERIRQSNERFEKVAQATNDAIWDWDIVNEGLYWGEGYATLFGHDPAKKDKTLASWSDLIHPDELDQVLDSLQKALDDKNVKIWQEEYRFKKSDGSYAFVVDRGSIIRNETGKAIRIVGALHDITRHKEHEETLKKLNADLEASIRDLAISNQELEQFAYVASHDLQEPLRMVTSFLSRLEKKYGDILDEKGKKYIHFAVDGTRRMRQIILDLLEFSRVGRTEDNLEKVDLNELIEEINSLYHRQIEEKNAKITFSDLPQLVTYRTPLRQVFQNLISNSLKYHKDGIPPVIRISFSETQTHWQFAVEDNGIGIDPEYYDKIFIIFQRLHNKDEYSGTGIGLAITKKIIENLGGSIWLESAEGEGCCFYFTIEKQKESNPEEK